ncbi:hypothetical protein BCV70DRAFT_13682 [Testicularia cyperi]|uniref:Secreted protein n=1 Tax=Testicularia cyperi TaxID=1882483 RepID=A0A317Y0S6_9BASI|nr:hypothetical protein BCV70DRAFT_13682 [Testicularia cyperi]
MFTAHLFLCSCMNLAHASARSCQFPLFAPLPHALFTGSCTLSDVAYHDSCLFFLSCAFYSVCLYWNAYSHL